MASQEWDVLASDQLASRSDHSIQSDHSIRHIRPLRLAVQLFEGIKMKRNETNHSRTHLEPINE